MKPLFTFADVVATPGTLAEVEKSCQQPGDSLALENILFVMTTNNIETLGQVLMRPEYTDNRLLLGKAAEEQKIELYRRFFPRATASEATEFVETYQSAETMAEFQGLLLALEQDRPASPTDRVFQDA